jgi:hypothetical protein
MKRVQTRTPGASKAHARPGRRRAGGARGCQPGAWGLVWGRVRGGGFLLKKTDEVPPLRVAPTPSPGPEVHVSSSSSSFKFQVSSWSSCRLGSMPTPTLKPGPHCRCSAQAAAQSTVPPVAPAAWSCGALLVLVLDRDSDVQYRGPLTALPACAALGLAGIPKRCVGPTLICALLAESCASRRRNKKVFKRLNLRASGHQF